MASTLTARLASSAFAAEMEHATIAYDTGVLESMRRAAQSAFDADSQPILGLLLGRLTPHGPSVTAWLPATSLPTGRDSNLSRAIELARLEYPGEYPIGWFRSKHQGEARLTTDELQTAGEVIPGGTPLALVLRPSSQRPLRVASYLPVAGIPMTAERPFQEFFIHPGAARSLPTPRPPAAALDTPARSGRRFRASMEGLRWAFPAGLLILIAVAAVSIAQVQSEDPVLPFTVIAKSANLVSAKVLPEPLRVSADGQQWLIRWDARTPVERATLVIGRDAKNQTLALSPSQYAAGSYSVPQHAGDLQVLLRTERSGKVASEIRTRVVGSATTPAPHVVSEQRMSLELDKIKLELQAERYRRQLLQDMVQSRNAASH